MQIRSSFRCLIANPTRFDPVRNPEAALERRDLALRRLVSVGLLTADVASYIGTAPLPAEINQFNPETQVYFVEEVKHPTPGRVAGRRSKRFPSGGIDHV